MAVHVSYEEVQKLRDEAKGATKKAKQKSFEEAYSKLLASKQRGGVALEATPIVS